MKSDVYCMLGLIGLMFLIIFWEAIKDPVLVFCPPLSSDGFPFFPKDWYRMEVEGWTGVWSTELMGHPWVTSGLTPLKMLWCFVLSPEAPYAGGVLGWLIVVASAVLGGVIGWYEREWSIKWFGQWYNARLGRFETKEDLK